MTLSLKIAVGVIVLLLLALGGATWYAGNVAEERDAAYEEVGRLSMAVDIAEAQAQERAAANKRLSTILSKRSVREKRVLAISSSLQEKINALSNTCTLSNDASGLLWEIYKRTTGVPGAGDFRLTPSTTD